MLTSTSISKQGLDLPSEGCGYAQTSSLPEGKQRDTGIWQEFKKVLPIL